MQVEYEHEEKESDVQFYSMKNRAEMVLDDCRRMEEDLSFAETNGEFLVNVIFYNDNPDGKSYLSSIKTLSKDFDITFKEYKNGDEIENKNAPYLIIGGTFFEQKAYARDYGLKNPLQYSVDPDFEPSVSTAVLLAIDYIREDLLCETRKIGKRVVIIGRSDNAFATAKELEFQRDCTVTLVHTRTEDISEYTKEADCIISFAGSPNLIKGRMVKDNAIIIPVGMKKDKGGFWLDDIDYESIEDSGKIVHIAQDIGPLTAAWTIVRMFLFYRNEAVSNRRALKEKYGNQL